MKIAITGIANSGKTTIFNALTGQSIEMTVYPTVEGEPHVSVVKVPDMRLERLAEIYSPRKPIHATVEYVDYIGLIKGDTPHNTKVFNLIRDADAIVHVVRLFEDEKVSHPFGGIDPQRDIAIFEHELIFGDLEIVEKRLERIELASKKGLKVETEAEKKLLGRIREALEIERPLREIEFNEDEERLLRPIQFLSIKPEVIVLNICEDDIHAEKNKSLKKSLEERHVGRNIKVIDLCGKIEMEIAQFDREEARAFLDDLRIDEPAMNRLIRLCYDLLGYISFFTIGENEVKAWAIKRGTIAQKAAGKVHSDMERGFIRAEVIGYDDFVASGGMAKAKEKGLVRLEGKTYAIKDGDIVNFRFHV
ncbi:MAG: redox-regulated ATPase YchF [Nitrospirota bacterium]